MREFPPYNGKLHKHVARGVFPKPESRSHLLLARCGSGQRCWNRRWDDMGYGGPKGQTPHALHPYAQDPRPTYPARTGSLFRQQAGIRSSATQGGRRGFPPDGADLIKSRRHPEFILSAFVNAATDHVKPGFPPKLHVSRPRHLEGQMASGRTDGVPEEHLQA